MVPVVRSPSGEALLSPDKRALSQLDNRPGVTLDVARKQNFNTHTYTLLSDVLTSHPTPRCSVATLWEVKERVKSTATHCLLAFYILVKFYHSCSGHVTHL